MKQCFLKEIVAWMLLIVVIITIVAWTGYLFIPERYDYGALWNMYLCEPNNTIDTIIIGSSLAYCDVMPSVIDEITGERSYVLAAPELTAALSYYYVVEALKTQSPDLIVIEVTSLLWGKYAGYSKIDVGYMPFGLNRVKATLDAAEQEQRFGLFVPIYNYHDRWQYVNPIKYVMGRSDSKIDINAGYTYLDEAVEQNEIKDRNYDISDTEFEENLKYLEDTIDFCSYCSVVCQIQQLWKMPRNEVNPIALDKF